MMTDVLELKEKGLKVSCLNLSCGYYEPHTDHEFTVKKDLLKLSGTGRTHYRELSVSLSS